MKKTLGLALIFVFYFFSTTNTYSQNCIPTNLNGTTVTYPCNSTCQDLRFSVPDLRSDEDYVISTIPYQFYPATSGTEVPNLYEDDVYSAAVPLTFPFCFYDSTYTNIIIGSNSIVTFEALCATKPNNYILDPPIFIPNNTVPAPTTIMDRYIPRTAIMAGYMDINPRLTSGSPLRRIEYNVFGSAPCRKFVISYYNVQFFDCEDLKMTSQIVLHEGTGLIDIFISEKPICPGWEDGNAILGIQDYTRTKAVVAPGKNCTQWTEINTGYRFTPAGATSRLINSQITSLAGTVLSTATTSPGATGMVNVNFPNFCPSPFGQYILKTTYDACPTGNTIVSTDTINLVQSPFLNFTAAATDAACGLNNGTITVTVPPGSGVGPYTYVLDGGTGQPGNVFTNVSGGPHTVTVTDNTGCTNTLPVNVIVVSNLNATITSTATSCSGLDNGTITVVPTSGTGPYTFVLTPGGETNTTGIFNGLIGGSYSVTFTDVNSCNGTQTINVATGAPIDADYTATATSCSAANDATVTVTPLSGVAPYIYSIDGGPTQASNIFTGLSAGIHTVLVKDNAGCSVGIFVEIDAGGNLTASIFQTAASCPGVNDGTVTLVPTTGTTPFTYSLDGGPYQSSNTFTGVAPGVHTVTFLDANNCSGSRTTNVGGGTTPSTSATSANTTCAGANNGVIVINPIPGSVYTITPGGSNTTGTFLGLGAGVYTLSIATSGGCAGTITPSTVTIGSGPALSTTATASPASCSGISNGTITVAPVGTGTTTYTLNPGAVSNTTGIFTGLATGTYTVTFATAAGCTGTISPNPVVTANASPTSTATATAASCPGAPNGTVTVASAGTGTTYTINPGGTSNTTGIFTGLVPGIYTVTFVTAAGCNGTVPVNPEVTAGPGPAINASPMMTSCAGANDGSIIASVAINPGTGGLFTLTPGGQSNTTGTFTGLTAATYTVTYSNAEGCSVSRSVTVISGITPTAFATTTPATCPGANNGTITITPSGGPGTVYSINPGGSNSTGIFTGLAPGNYQISYVTATNCTGMGMNSVTVGAGSNPTTTALSTATTCPGASDGSITVTPVGTGTTTYTLNPGAVSNTTGIFTGLAAGSYTITFVTAIGCNGTVPTNPVVVNGSSPTTTAVAAATSCPGVNDGTITVAPVGTGTTTYTLNPGAVTNTTGIFTGLAAGIYTITFTTGGCSGTVPVSPVVTSGPSPTSTAVATATTCPGVNDGTLTVAPVGAGTTYTLNPGAISNTTGIFTGLAAGSYTITFVTSIGCNGTVTGNTTVTTGAAITGTATAVNTTCPSVNNGSITVNTPAGPGTTYTLNPGAITNTTGIFTGLAPNTYTISFVTATGCTGTVSPNPVINAGPSLTSVFIQTNPVCATANDGSISITPQAGTTAPYAVTLTGPGGPYNYTGAGPILFTGLAAGIYNYTYSEAGGCTGTGGPITLVTNPPIFTPVVLVNPSCNNSSNGTVTFNTTGGVAPYQYRLNPGGAFQSSNTFTGLGAGIYFFTIRDNAGCLKDTSVQLTQPTVLTATVTGSTPAGCSNNDGSISSTAAGGTAPYIYSIAGATVNTSGASTGIFTGLATGAYIITATDAQGCTRTANGNVGLTDNMFLTLGPDVTICAEASVTFDPQTNPETNVFTWTGINGTPNSTIVNASVKNAAARPLDTATYVLHAQWGGCERWDTIVVNVLRKPVANAGLDTAICNKTYAILRGSSSNLSGTVNYAWSPVADVEFPNQAVTRVNPPGNNREYIYTLTVTDNYGCNFSVTDEVRVRVQPPVPAFAGNDTTAVRGVPHQMFATGGDEYLWTPAGPLSNASAQNPLATLNTDQKFVVRVTDFAGCIGYDTVFIKVYAGPAYYIPNAFTPNGDGLNDVFRPIPAGIARTQYFRIFNRFGEVIFETNQFMKGWDGTYKGKKQPIGAYVWVIKGIDRNGQKVEMKGTVMLVQ